MAGLIFPSIASSGTLKPRVVILTDINESFETDDTQSMVRALSHADQVEIEGLIATSGWGNRREPNVELLPPLVEAYGKDLPNLMKRSGQTEFLEDERRQRRGYWPSEEYLMERIAVGQHGAGNDNDLRNVGPGKDSPGSDLIIEVVDRDDPRPVWVLVWGGPNTLAQAIDTVQRTRSAPEVEAFIRKIRVHAIECQDSAINQDVPEDDPYNSGQWLRREVPGLFYIWNHHQFRKFANDSTEEEWVDFYNERIQGQGNLGAAYPDHTFAVEGDTPSWFHVMQPALTDPERPNWGSWGGLFGYGASRQDGTVSWTDDLEEDGGVRAAGEETVDLWLVDTWHDFAARMEWAATGEGSVNPVAVINGDSTDRLLRKTVKAGDTVELDASESYDPDGTELVYSWIHYEVPGSYSGDLDMGDADQSKVTLTVPEDFGEGDIIHLVLTVRDSGPWQLPAYRRVLLVASGFENWRAANFPDRKLEDPEISGPLADPSGRGLSNLKRYAFGLSSHGPVGEARPALELTNESDARHVTLTFLRNTGADDVNFHVEGFSGFPKEPGDSVPHLLWEDPVETERHRVVRESVRLEVLTEDFPRAFMQLMVTQEE